jgi:hypothetical protein
MPRALFAATLFALIWAAPAWAQRGSAMLLIFAPDAENKPVAAEYDKLKQGAVELDQVGVDIVYVIGDGPIRMPPDDHRVDAASLRKRYHIDANAFRMVLVGSEGLEKARWGEPVEPHQIAIRAREMPKQREPLPGR